MKHWLWEKIEKHPRLRMALGVLGVGYAGYALQLVPEQAQTPRETLSMYGAFTMLVAGGLMFILSGFARLRAESDLPVPRWVGQVVKGLGAFTVGMSSFALLHFSFDLGMVPALLMTPLVAVGAWRLRRWVQERNARLRAHEHDEGDAEEQHPERQPEPR